MGKDTDSTDLGIRHAYIKRGTPQLNGKVERSPNFSAIKAT
jgi:transposase InsO family protein